MAKVAHATSKAWKRNQRPLVNRPRHLDRKPRCKLSDSSRSPQRRTRLHPHRYQQTWSLDNRFYCVFLRSVVRLNPNMPTTIPVLRVLKGARRGRENKYCSRPRRTSNNSIVVVARKQLSRVRLDQFNGLKNKGRFVYGSGEPSRRCMLGSSVKGPP